jgi:hypothetical protein
MWLSDFATAKNAKAPDGGFRLMIAMRFDKTALVDRLNAHPLAWLH